MSESKKPETPVPAPATTAAPAEPAAGPAPAADGSTAPVTDPAAVTPPAAGPVVKPKKKFGLKLPFGKKNQPVPADSPKDKKKEPKIELPPVTPEETIEALEEGKLDGPAETTVPAKTLKPGQIILRIKKKSIILAAGLLIASLWLGLVLEESLKTKPWTQLPTLLNQKSSPPVPSAAPVPLRSQKIRIKVSTEATSAADLAVADLKTAGYDQIEVMSETQEKYAGLTVVTQPNQAELKQKLEAVLAADYKIASSSSVLTEDSDFGAVILLGSEQ